MFHSRAAFSDWFSFLNGAFINGGKITRSQVLILEFENSINKVLFREYFKFNLTDISPPIFVSDFPTFTSPSVRLFRQSTWSSHVNGAAASDNFPIALTFFYRFSNFFMTDSIFIFILRNASKRGPVTRYCSIVAQKILL